MKITKIHLDDMYRCYCASSIEVNDELNLLLASEEVDGPCYAYSGERFEKRESVWDHGGGTMSIIPIPNKKNEFLAVQDFYLKVSPSKAKIVWGKYGENGWEIKDVLYLPYLHRFDIYDVNGVNYFIAATIATVKENKEDWRSPGKIYIGKMNDNLEDGIELTVLKDGLFRNHGYFSRIENGQYIGYFGSDQGILKVTPPQKEDGEWKSETIMEGTISEIAIMDIDGDGEDEIMTIEPFHGNQIYIYKKDGNEYKRVYEYRNEIDFAHTLVATTLRGVPTFLAGVRRNDCELFYVQYIDGKFETTVIERGCGPANLAVVNQKDQDLIIAANHTLNEAAVYIVKD
ncbi:hypothetical protein [Breznakia pachnodae]|uniref:VCBS repeat-containing protein n=1 Tax=Breznakia pachnodae TaxID=265178 RepID=A0ABU0E1I5_9FIRM|nr:hypothetical protein [Breznakia pachnodae]MDQ0360671.1 hypothetical protein [Breznakia pachnodae]